jgi:hypothetical protein
MYTLDTKLRLLLFRPSLSLVSIPIEPKQLKPTVSISLTDNSRFMALPEGNVMWTSQTFMYVGTEEGDLKTVGFTLKGDITGFATVKGFGLFGGGAYNCQKAGQSK